MRRGVWSAGAAFVVAFALGVAGCGWEEGQPVGHTQAKQEWHSPTAADRGDDLRDRLQVTQSDH
ncbi:hypothetical protein SVA_2331 [Sulfurifustis variabilis]|uniref:Lipoprotein n=1 Tax=Sulfurifustis variabilis TaxID=1675686 RepID=A0A1B4VC81_9GAMM|nr:hypothetical protein [Sulfurifustis variabilis]BAU48881.1 hypothetical protein SVA_2331 [Sulfurifustis variabilis]